MKGDGLQPGIHGPGFEARDSTGRLGDFGDDDFSLTTLLLALQHEDLLLVMTIKASGTHGQTSSSIDSLTCCWSIEAAATFTPKGRTRFPPCTSALST